MSVLSEERKFFKNITSMALSMVLPNLLNLVLVMIVARILLKPGMDDYNVVISYPAMFATLSDLGLTGVMVRDVSRDNSRMREYFGTFLGLRLVTAILMAFLSLIVLNFMPYSGEIKGYIYLATIAQLVFQSAQIFSATFQAAEKMEYITYGTILQTVLLFALSILFLDMGMRIDGLVYASIIANLAMLAVYIIWTRRRVTTIGLGLNAEMYRYFIFSTLPFTAYSIFSILSGYADRILISILRYGDMSNYAQPFNLVASLSFISTAYIVSVFPLFSKISVKSNGSIKYACEKSFKYLIMLMLPICVGTTLLADRIVYTLYGPALPGAIPILKVLIWALAILAINGVGSTLLNATHRERANMINLGLCVALSIILNIIVIPIFGAIGSSFVYLLMLSVYAILTLYLIRNDIKDINILGPLLKIAVASAAMAVAIILFNINNLFLYVTFGAIVYFAVFVIVGGIAKDDIELVKKILFGGSPGAKAPSMQP